jgi:hypothetical protein
MNKTFLTVMMMLSGLALVYAEAPELRYVMPNSWRKVTRLTPAEETAFLQENRAIEDAVKTKIKHSLWFHDLDILEHTLVYKQTAGTDEFYRMILVHEQEPDFTSGLVSFVQALVYKKSHGNMLLAMCTYKERGPAGENSDADAREQYHSIDIMEGGGRAKGILLSTLVTLVDYGENYRPIFRRYEKGQPAGSVKAYYMPMDWTGDTAVLEQPVRSIGSEYLPDTARYIEIDGSRCLIDPRSPLRYGLASAFDNDPSTSYVENTEDDLMSIYLYSVPFQVQRSAIINGYAQNMLLYKKNNRIKQIDIHKVNWSRINEPNNVDIIEHILLDDMLAYQFIDVDNSVFWVKDVYRGSDYADTCLAEYNIYVDEIGWLFGDINE